jgi:predicted transcriptional regulator
MEIRNLSQFLSAMVDLLRIVDSSKYVLFRVRFRDNISESITESADMLTELAEHGFIRHPEESEDMTRAGLNGSQLVTKLESFEFSFNEFDEKGGIHNLEDALDKGGTILSSLAGAIPGFGSFAQELVDFILKELKRRFRVWPL